MSAEILELLTRIAELERKLDSMFRHGPVHERKKIDGRWFIRLKIGGTDEEPFLSPWVPYSSPNGGPQGLNVHRVPAKGEQLTMLSPAGDFRQAVAVPLFWSDDHSAPSDEADALVVTHPLFRLEIENGVLTIECERFNLKGRDGSGISMVDGKLTLKADIIETDGETRLDKGTRPVHRVQDHDSRGEAARRSEGATMEIKRSGSQPSGKGPADWFTGTVRIDPLFTAPAPARVSGAAVTFEPCARTAWHTHPLGQTLIVTSGCGLVQRDGGPIEEVRPGDVVWFLPGEKHWHGASPTTAMTHIAIQESLDGKAVEWMEHVTDEQYGARAGTPSRS